MGAAPPPRQLRDLSHQPDAAQPDPARRDVVAARCLQVAEEALPTQLPDLRGGLLPPRHHRSAILKRRSDEGRGSVTGACLSVRRARAAAAERGEAGEDGAGAGDAAAGAAATGAAAAGAGGGTQPAAAQQEPRCVRGGLRSYVRGCRNHLVSTAPLD